VLLLALRHPATPPAVKAGIVLLALYVVSPFDAITDLLPFAGGSTSLALLAVAVPWLRARVPQAARRDALSRLAGWRGRGGARRP
jgi:uncharacterized membrane protein YkvA (DUF1232 family)